jgi:uncharacterized protein (DUF4415 family)
MKKEISKVVFELPSALSPEQEALANRLAAAPDEDIDFSDIPRTTEADWKGSVRGDFKPIKRSITIRLDADILTYYRTRAITSAPATRADAGYQTLINEVLREYMASHPMTEAER